MRMADRGFPEAQEKNMINQKSKMAEEHCSVITTGETEQSGSLSWSFMQHELVDEAIRRATTGQEKTLGMKLYGHHLSLPC